MSRFAINGKKKNRETFVLPFSLGNTARHPLCASAHPYVEKLNPVPGRIGKRGALVNTPSLAWVYTLQKEEEVESTDISSFSKQMGSCCLSK
jgi:hypothetical protein